ncbi:protein KTI12 homolog, partial [Caerostris extrusa]
IYNENRNSPEKYSEEIFKAVIQRYETPDSRNRWDSPLFIVHKDEELPLEDIEGALYRRKAPPPNLSTQTVHLMDPLTAGELARIRRQFISYVKTHPVSDGSKIPNMFVHILVRFFPRFYSFDFPPHSRSPPGIEGNDIPSVPYLLPIGYHDKHPIKKKFLAMLATGHQLNHHFGENPGSPAWPKEILSHRRLSCAVVISRTEELCSSRPGGTTQVWRKSKNREKQNQNMSLIIGNILTMLSKLFDHNRRITEEIQTES